MTRDPRPATLAACLAFSSVSNVARAAEPSDVDRPYEHPLLSPAGVELTDALLLERWTPAEVFAGLSWRGGLSEPTIAWAPPTTSDSSSGDLEDPKPGEMAVAVEVRTWLAAGPAADETLAVALSLRTDAYSQGVSADYAVALAIIEGYAFTTDDVREVRAEWRDLRELSGREALEAREAAIVDEGGRVLGATYGAGVLAAEVTPSALLDILDDPAVASVTLNRVYSEDFGVAGAGQAQYVTGVDFVCDYNPTPDITCFRSLTGRDVADLIQSNQFYGRGYYGTGDTIALLEGDEADDIHRAHPGFSDNLGATRWTNCTHPWCGNPNPTSIDKERQHETSTASVLIGDLTRGQDAAITASAAREDRSGVARRAHGLGLSYAFADADWPVARMIAHDVRVANMSMSASADDCEGTDPADAEANYVFESGIALFKSAGNNEHADPYECTVGIPGSAIGVFPVAAYQVSAAHPSVSQMDVNSSRGGTVTEGRGRTIIGLAAPSGHRYTYTNGQWPVDYFGDPYSYGADWTNGLYDGPYHYTDTSGAAPVVTGAAALFREWYHDVVGSDIDEPGLLYANMLLMGDRAHEGSYEQPGAYPMASGFDNLWGAGRLRLRMGDATGLDDPGYFDNGTFCLAQGYTQTIDALIPQGGADITKAVVWWYDRRHQDGVTAIDDASVTLLTGSTVGGWTSLRTADTEDNRERVASNAALVGGDYLRLQIHGDSITADAEGCGQDANRIYWAMVFENSERESAESLGDIRIEEGIDE